jgi:hypothetical protein
MFSARRRAAHATATLETSAWDIFGEGAEVIAMLERR